ncbi:MAG: Nuclear envelope morphology protein 1 [Piccolia ochrophora]|nr:MAG: Nuclear envelope morphology protein 1 [Piccolia ochrophora]
MNSLNLLSARIIGPPVPQTPTQKHSTSDYGTDIAQEPDAGDSRGDASLAAGTQTQRSEEISSEAGDVELEGDGRRDDVETPELDEKTPLLNEKDPGFEVSKPSKWVLVPQRVASAFVESIKLVLSTLAIPGVYLITCFYDDKGRFSPLMPIRTVRRMILRPRRSRSTAQAIGLSAASEDVKLGSEKPSLRHKLPAQRRGTSTDSIATVGSSDSDNEQEEIIPAGTDNGTPAHHTRSKSNVSSSEDEINPTRRSIRIKVHSEESQKARKQRKLSHVRPDGKDASSSNQAPALTPATIKSPTSTSSSLRMTKYPRAAAPPRPLIPRRMPSYALPSNTPRPQKTLILDLDETLIHSLAKGGRMSTGHMVEVKLNAPVGLGGGVALAPQHPILYYVHKRPHCDDFLRKVSKWYNLVAFTASVQEYADPVIDWLEQDRKYFTGRYYRQHCTFRGGNYIKDLSHVEPDLSKVMIVDNSPASYIFHEDNAIPIEGWINDPTDNDLLHLIPLLEALQYVTDVRALLALRMGESSPV